MCVFDVGGGPIDVAFDVGWVCIDVGRGHLDVGQKHRKQLILAYFGAKRAHFGPFRAKKSHILLIIGRFL